MALGLVVALTGAACGGGDDDTLRTSDIDVEATAEATLAHFAGDAIVAAGAVLQGVDRGYTPDQIEAASEGGTLDADGFVVADGEVVAPADDAVDVITDKAETPASGDALALIAALGRAQGGDTFTTDDLFDGLEVLQNDIADARADAAAEAEAQRRAEAEAQRAAGIGVLIAIFDLLARGTPPAETITSIVDGSLDASGCLGGYSPGCVEIEGTETPDDGNGGSAGDEDAAPIPGLASTYSITFTHLEGVEVEENEGTIVLDEDGNLSGTGRAVTIHEAVAGGPAGASGCRTKAIVSVDFDGAVVDESGNISGQVTVTLQGDDFECPPGEAFFSEPETFPSAISGHASGSAIDGSIPAFEGEEPITFTGEAG